MIQIRAGKPEERNPGEKPPCSRCPKVPRDAPAFPRYAIELSPRNVKALEFHSLCKLLGKFPADPIILRNAKLIEEVETEIREEKEQESRRGLRTVIQLALLRVGR